MLCEREDALEEREMCLPAKGIAASWWRRLLVDILIDRGYR